MLISFRRTGLTISAEDLKTLGEIPSSLVALEGSRDLMLKLNSVRFLSGILNWISEGTLLLT